MYIEKPNALGFQTPTIIGVSVELGMIDQVAKTLAELPEASYLVMTMGAFDSITQHVRSIPGVRSTEMLMIARSLKLGYRCSPALGLEAETAPD